GFDYLSLYNGSLLVLPDGTAIKEYRIAREDFCLLEALFETLPGLVSFDRAGAAAFYPHYYALADSRENALAAAERVNGLYGDRVTAFVNGEWVNIGRRGSSKTQGVYDALAYFGLPDDAAAVFGDDYNDLDMIVTHRGWAVETGRPEVVAAAPHVCESIAAAVADIMGNRF
ncbi:MAG: HAD hydrolase family protein, partial [Clostridia bacterium]|nr:HAD hydrolase family protein [Clostridia bacterium]